MKFTMTGELNHLKIQLSLIILYKIPLEGKQ